MVNPAISYFFGHKLSKWIVFGILPHFMLDGNIPTKRFAPRERRVSQRWQGVYGFNGEGCHAIMEQSCASSELICLVYILNALKTRNV